MTVEFTAVADRQWRPTDRAGVTYAVLRVHGAGEGATVLTRFTAGTAGGQHLHPGGEELYVIAGTCAVNGVQLRTGDYLYTPPGERHELVALTDTVVLVHLPRLPIYDTP